MKIVSSILTCLLFFLAWAPGGIGQPTESNLETVTLSTTLHFLSPTDDDVTVPPGTYTVAVEEEGMRLKTGTEGQSYLIAAQFSTHDHDLTLPGAMLIPGENNTQYLTFLFPSGESFEAVGSTSGVLPRGFLSGGFKIPQKGFQSFLKQLQQKAAEAQKSPPEIEMEAECINRKAKQVSNQAKKCTGDKEKVCPVWDPPQSNSCKAMHGRKIAIDFSYFGKSDCRSWPLGRKEKVTMIVIHNGDNANGNKSTWDCRVGASHYTIDRDGKIFQHVGEERHAAHAKRVNQQAIGIELQILRAWKDKKSLGSCNGIDQNMAKKMGTTQEALVRQLCAPTPEQYRSLKILIDDIKSRHPIAENGVIGHCEVEPRGGHGDPRAFDWQQIGLSNTGKQDVVKNNRTACSWYHLY